MKPDFAYLLELIQSTKKGSPAVHIPYTSKMRHLHEGVGPGSLVSGLQLPGWWPDLAIGQRELDL